MVVQMQLGRPEILRAPSRDGKDVGLDMVDRRQVQDSWRLESSPGDGPMAGRTDGKRPRQDCGMSELHYAAVSCTVVLQAVAFLDEYCMSAKTGCCRGGST
jgi:hypothetical protein